MGFKEAMQGLVDGVIGLETSKEEKDKRIAELEGKSAKLLRHVEGLEKGNSLLAFDLRLEKQENARLRETIDDACERNKRNIRDAGAQNARLREELHNFVWDLAMCSIPATSSWEDAIGRLLELDGRGKWRETPEMVQRVEYWAKWCPRQYAVAMKRIKELEGV